MQTITIAAKNISKSFTTGKVKIDVIKNCSIEISSRKLTLLMGPSGSGKSTLLAMLSGLSHPDSGEIKTLGKSITHMSDRELEKFRLENCGFVFQGFNLFPALTATEQVMLPLKYLGVKKNIAKERAEKSLQEVGLYERRYLRPIELSGGEKQRVALARAFVREPKLLFADEPTSALDKESGMRVITMMQHFAHEHGSTVLCVTHDPRLIEHSDRLLNMEDGVIVDVSNK
jgi:putative ABC transport system ATP-binding protein